MLVRGVPRPGRTVLPSRGVAEMFSGHGPLIVVRSLSVPTGSHESKTDLYGSLTLTNGWEQSSGTAFQQGEYDSTPVTGLAPLRPHGVTGSAVRITVNLWDHWEPLFISDTHIANGVIDTSLDPFGVNTKTISGDDDRSVTVIYTKSSTWMEFAVLGVNLTSTHDSDPAAVYGRMSVCAYNAAFRVSCDKNQPHLLFRKDPVDAVNVSVGSSIWSQTPPVYVYSDDSTRKGGIMFDAYLYQYRFMHTDGVLAEGTPTLMQFGSVPDQDKWPHFELDGPDGSVTLYLHTVRRTA
ncbi:hypothetical protein [Leifsonia xyli]|uniref:hypothetical protein n=1 Tax=Leifsonia xyli TaxID=1575 RepID=UPI00114D37F9|nr:hypothetical protein [Leifsonia xyli]